MRDKLSKQLKSIRIKKNVKKRDIKLRHELLTAVEEGSTNYTIDTLGKYLQGIKADIIIQPIEA